MNSTTKHAMRPEFDEKWRMECLNIAFPLPTLLCAGYSVKLIICKINYLLLLSTVLLQSWRSGTRCDCKTDWLWVRSPLEEMKYLLKLIFPFIRSSVEVKRGVEFCHSTRNASIIRGTECLNTRFPLPTLLCAGDSVKLFFL